ncbi:MAG: 7-cyano-7-deazaguanine synthase, partial [Candidatus Omnitrophota bacterium]
MKAIVLFSGGLDSTLAIKVILDEGIEVEALNFFTPFCLCDRNSGCGAKAKSIKDEWGVKLKVFPLSDEYLNMIKNPKHGYGSSMNPCIDCRILMYKKAKEYMNEIGASFIVSGEVLGQRPMSQHKRALMITEKESGLEGLILRPLSAKLLPITIPEKEGWVKREKMLEISGRSRKPQIELASDYNIKDFPCSAGGCLLTDAGFSRRIRDLIKHSEFNMANIELLKVGRHFRLTEKAKVAVGRNEKENKRLENLRRPGDMYFHPIENNGPMAVGRGKIGKEEIDIITRVVARYCDRNGSKKVKIAVNAWPGEVKSIVAAAPINDAELDRLRI